MSFDRHYPNRKDRRAPYRGAKRFIGSCRNHGGCPHCLDNRLYADRRRMPQVELEAVEQLPGLGLALVRKIER